MKLITARVKEYKSIWDSNHFEIGDITCLVGKNEAGKTALLQALYKLNPIISADSEFDVTNDYPRAEVSDYEEDVLDKNRHPATVVEGTFELQGDDIEVITSLFGKKALKNNTLTISRKYPDPHDSDSSTRAFSLEANKDESINHLIGNANIPADLQEKLTEAMGDVTAMLELLAEVEATEATEHLIIILKVIQEHDVSWYIYNKLLSSRVPKFLYFDEYYQMKGHENIETLQSRQKSETLEQSDYPMLGLIGLARLNLDQLLNPASTQDLVSA